MVTKTNINYFTAPSFNTAFKVLFYIYFLVNSLGLPLGLQYTTIISPLLFIWLLTNNYKNVLLYYFLVSAPFIIVHLYNGVNVRHYIITTCMILSTYIITISLFASLPRYNELRSLFHNTIIIYFLLACIALPFKNTTFSELLWWKTYISESLEN